MPVRPSEAVAAPERPPTRGGPPARSRASRTKEPSGYPIGPSDRSFLRRTSTHRPTTGFFLDFDGPPPARMELAARVLERAQALPALNDLIRTADGSRWRAGAGVLDAAVHIHCRTGLNGPGHVDEAANDLLHQPLPPEGRPQWDLWLLAGSEPEGFRLCFRVHHAIQDGVGAAHSALALLADSATRGPHPHQASRPTPSGMLRAGRDVARALRPERRWPELQAAPTGRSRWTYADVSATRLRDLADAHGASVNDVCLAALAMALRTWRHERTASTGAGTCPDLPTLVPMSTRQAHELHTPGNRTVAHRLLLPCSEERLRDAVARVHRQTAVVRRDRRRDAARAALDRPLVPALADWTVRAMGNPRTTPLSTSSITFPATFSCFGARLAAASMFYNVQENLPTYVSFTRTPTTVRCALMRDDALARTAPLPHLWRRALDETAV
ncbi:wax ester/triacylglycerol synthase domain-containing protein [Streptomyces triculaminicus]|uniref:wax ester/triacylglycerol synthase domain-containing protein n=1 Tax=Streptomyces triculaminicus TaxID=2816232 RepID=UPI0033D959E7